MSASRGILALSMAGLLWVGPAAAQSGQDPLDVHGAVPPAPAGDASSPITLWSPREAARGTWAIGALGELVDTPAVQQQLVAPGEIRSVSVLGAVGALNLGGWYAPLERLAVGGVLPVFLASGSDLPGVAGGPALGDLYVRASVGLLLPDEGEGFGVSVVPWVLVPTGATQRFLGDAGPGLGAIAVVGWRNDRLSVDANVGLSASDVADRATQQLGGLEVPLGLAGGVRVADGWWTHVEARGLADLGGGLSGVPEVSGGTPAFPVELLLTVSADLGDAWAAAGIGRGVTGGIGAANLRAFAGAGVTSRPLEDGDPALRPVVFRVTDPTGQAVAGAEVWAGDDTIGSTAPSGEVSLERVRWGRGVEVRSSRHLTSSVSEPLEGVFEVDVVLAWRPQPVSARITNQEGEAVAATVTVRDGEGVVVAEGPPDAVELVPGTYRVEIAAAGLGTQVRELVVEDGRPPRPVEAVLLPDAGPGSLELVIRGDDGTPVAGARVLVDGLPVGTTGDGGVLDLRGVAPGDHSVTVQHQAYTERVLEAVAVSGSEPALVPLSLERIPGTVRVQVRGPDGGVVPDALVRFLGPRVLPATPIGDRGERVQVLGPGRWTVLVTSESYGVQEREVLVPEDRYEVIDVDVRLREAEAGDVELEVTVVTSGGTEVDGATVWLDDEEVGRISTGGSLRLKELAPGTRTLRVGGDDLRTWEESIVLVSGSQRQLVEVGWLPGTVEVIARSPDGPVADARVRFMGSTSLGPDALGRTGSRRFQLDDGEYVVLVSSETWGVQERDLLLPADSSDLHRIDVGFLPIQGGMATLALRVVGPEGQPVADAGVWLDGTAIGSTGTQGSLRQAALAVGSRSLEVRSPLYRDVTTTVRLLEGTTDQEIELDWAPGAARVRVTHEGQPVPDAVVRFLGADVRSPVPVDGTGAATAALTDGPWTVLVTSPTMGVAQRTLDISTSTGGLAELEVAMVPPDTSLTSLVLTVVDAERTGVVGAEVWVDDSRLGTTGEGGVFTTSNLPPGTASLRVVADAFVALDGDLVLGTGTVNREVSLAWVPVPLTVSVADESGAPLQAEVRFSGRVDVEPARAAANGVAKVDLRPGEWQVIASDPARGLGPARVEVTLAPGSSGEAVALVLERARVELTAEAVVIKERVSFEFDSAQLKADAAPVLQQVADTLLSRGGIVRLEVQGHTDAIGDIAYNQALSERRAKVVQQALVDLGVSPEKLVARGYGTQRPIDGNDTDEGRAANRRVVFEIVEQVD